MKTNIMNLPLFLINAENIYVLTIDITGKIIFSNASFNKKIAGSGNDLTGSGITELIALKDHTLFKDLLNNCILTNKAFNILLTFRNELKADITIRWEFSPYEYDKGIVKQITGIGYEVNHHSTEIQKVQELSDLVIDNLPGIFYMQDETGKYLKWNKNFEIVSGYSSAEIPLLSPLVFFDKKDHQRIERSIATAFAQGSVELEAEIITKHHQVIPYFFNKRLINYQGKVCLIGTGIDITQKIKTDNKIRESEEKYHSLFEQASDPITITDFSGNFIDVNTSMCKLFGYSRDELLQMNVASLMDREQLEAFPARFDLLVSGEHIFMERKMMHKDGSIIYVQANAKKFADNFVMVIARDVTELKKAEANLIAQEKQLRLFVEHSPAAIAMFDNDMRYINVSRRWITDYNLVETEVIGRTHYEVFPGIPQHWKDIHQRCLAGATEKNDEDSFIREDGSIEWLRWEIHPWYKAFGEIGGIIMLTEVITDKKKTEFALKEAELKFRNLVEKSLAGVYIMQHGKYAYVNPRFAEIFGYTQAELIESFPVEIVVSKEDSESILQTIRARIQDKIDSFHYEFRGQKKDGQKIWVDVFGSRTIYNGSTAIIGTLIDITGRKEAAEENERIQYMLNERVKELTTLYRFSQVLQSDISSIDELLEELVLLLPQGWQYPDIAAARIVYGKSESKTPNFAPGVHHQQASFQTSDGTNVLIEVVYLQQRSTGQEDAFLTEERHMFNILTEMFKTYLSRKSEAEALKKSEANLHTIFDTTDIIYVLLDKKFHIISHNKQATDFAAKELHHHLKISEAFLDYFPDERRATVLKQMKKALAGEHINYETFYPQPDGTFNWYNVRILRITGNDGEIFGIILAVLDITEKKMLEVEILEQKIQQQKKISRAIIKAQEKERNHIGQELHDNVNQILSGTKLYMQFAANGNETVQQLIKYPMELIDSSIHEIRLLSSRQVTPLKNIRLKELILSLLEKLEKTASIQTELLYETGEHSLKDELKLNIYRIIQEQVNNITKYAEAKNVSISIQADKQKINIIIADNGVGFDVKKKRKGIGISNMINRVEAFNGEVLIESSPGDGTKILISIPCVEK